MCIQKITIYDVQFLRYGVRQTELFVILGGFLPFSNPPSPLMIPKIKILKKKLKRSLEILSFYTYMWTINEDHVIYGSWNIRCNKQKFSSFWAIFCLFSTLTTWKTKILKLKKIPEDVCVFLSCHVRVSEWIHTL